MGELIAVVSGKGGTGKTSVTAAVASALARSGKRVLCIDCDVGLRIWTSLSVWQTAVPCPLQMSVKVAILFLPLLFIRIFRLFIF